ncbi:hypothetical protein K474DRAFT_1675647 [Panus rudis PR-1116 ss-1]|nr:hypothetical protein K474DRAFT_1675647 [Panus rudis PR-1116 ss-1]
MRAVEGPSQTFILISSDMNFWVTPANAEGFTQSLRFPYNPYDKSARSEEWKAKNERVRHLGPAYTLLSHWVQRETSEASDGQSELNDGAFGAHRGCHSGEYFDKGDVATSCGTDERRIIRTDIAFRDYDFGRSYNGPIRLKNIANMNGFDQLLLSKDVFLEVILRLEQSSATLAVKFRVRQFITEGIAYGVYPQVLEEASEPNSHNTKKEGRQRGFVAS